MKDLIRTFVAIEINPAIRARAGELIGLLRGAARDARGGDVKWVETQNLHLTMKFLGDVPSCDMAHVCRAVEQAGGQTAPFELEIRGAGAFPNFARPRTIWLGAATGAPEMIALYDRLEVPLAKLGYREEQRQFQTHLTIGRVRGGGPSIAALARLLQQHAEFLAGRMTVNQLAVFSSTLTPAGPIYQRLSAAPLRGEP